jgi:hypothetical protein
MLVLRQVIEFIGNALSTVYPYRLQLNHYRRPPVMVQLFLPEQNYDMKQISKDILELARASDSTWCILRKEDEILQGIHNDIDLFVAPRDYGGFIAHLRNGFAQNAISILRERRMPAGVSFLLYSRNTDEIEKLDVLFENTLLFVSIFSSKEIAENIVPGAAYPVLSAEVAQELSFRKENVRRAPLAFLRHVWRTGRKKVRGPCTAAIRGFQRL